MGPTKQQLSSPRDRGQPSAHPNEPCDLAPEKNTSILFVPPTTTKTEDWTQEAFTLNYSFGHFYFFETISC